MFLYSFSPPEHKSKLYFSKKYLVQALGNLSTLIVWHCSSEIPDVLLTLVRAGWVWGKRAPSPTESEKQGRPSTGGEGERTHELVCPAVPQIGMAANCRFF